MHNSKMILIAKWSFFSSTVTNMKLGLPMGSATSDEISKVKVKSDPTDTRNVEVGSDFISRFLYTLVYLAVLLNKIF